MINKLFSAILFLGLGFSVMAKDFKIVTVTNNDDHIKYDLYVVADEEDNAKSLKMYDRAVKDWTHYEIKNLKNGVVLKQIDEYKVIVLKSGDFEQDRGGHFKLDYLSNGMTGKRKELPVSIEYNGTNWTVYHNGEKVNLLDFKVKKFLGKTIGIKGVDVK